MRGKKYFVPHVCVRLAAHVAIEMKLPLDSVNHADRQQIQPGCMKTSQCFFPLGKQCKKNEEIPHMRQFPICLHFQLLVAAPRW